MPINFRLKTIQVKIKKNYFPDRAFLSLAVQGKKPGNGDRKVKQPI